NSMELNRRATTNDSSDDESTNGDSVERILTKFLNKFIIHQIQHGCCSQDQKDFLELVLFLKNQDEQCNEIIVRLLSKVLFKQENRSLLMKNNIINRFLE